MVLLKYFKIVLSALSSENRESLASLDAPQRGGAERGPLVIGALLSTLLMVVMLLFAACEPTANICVGPDGRPSACAVYTCSNGTPSAGSPSGSSNVEQCASCNIFYDLNASNSCELVVVLGGALRISAATLSEFGVSEGLPYDLAAIGNTLYMVGSDTDSLYRLNTTDGTATRVGSATNFGVGETTPIGLAAIANRLYMVGATNDRLYTLNIDPDDGTPDSTAIPVGSATAFGVGETVPRGLAALGTTLYMVGSTTARLYRLNTTDGTATRVGSATNFGVGENSPAGLAALGTTLYMVGGSNALLYTLNTTDGTVTQVGSLSAGFGVGENFPTGLAAIGSILYMVGVDTDALHALRYQ